MQRFLFSVLIFTLLTSRIVAQSASIDELLKNPAANAANLIEWAEKKRESLVSNGLATGEVTFEDIAKIPIAYRAAAANGKPETWITLGNWYAAPLYGHPDFPAAEVAFQSGIEAKAPNAKLELAKFRWYFKRKTATQAEQAEAYRLLSEEISRKSDHDEAIYIKALMTNYGFGNGKPSPEDAFALLKKSAELGNGEALFELFIYYSHGNGVKENPDLAFESCAKAAHAGNPRAIYNMGAFYATGTHVEKDTVEAAKWYELAVNAGYPRALLGLAMIYGEGDGVEVDQEYARKVLDQAERAGLDVTAYREQLGL